MIPIDVIARTATAAAAAVGPFTWLADIASPGGIVLFVVAPKKKHTGLAHITPAVGPNFYGVSLGGSF